MTNRYWTLGFRLPAFLRVPLFGNRRRFGLEAIEEDPDWQAWQKLYFDFYQNTQKQGVGRTANDAGYQILRQVNLNNRNVMEAGPGSLPHLHFWKGKPASYCLVDIKEEFLSQSLRVLQARDIPSSSHLSFSSNFPLEDCQFDVVISFYSLEHMYPLTKYVLEIKRILRPGGLLVGAIPCEGGIAWGAGRFITSRRYIKENSTADPDKIICWEHPNFAEEILRVLASYFEPIQLKFWPLGLPLIDLNLICGFIFKKGR